LKIGQEELVWVEAGRGWTGRRHDRCVIRPLEPGLIRVSPTEPNLVEPAPVQEQVRNLVGPSRRMGVVGQSMMPPVPVPIVLLLPDVCVRTAVFELERIPRKKEERDALVRWRFGQDHLFPLAGAKVSYQFLSGNGTKEATKRTTVLAVAIHESVLHQYEALCTGANLVPVEVTTSTFQLCNLWLESRPAQPREAAGGDVLWVNLLDRTFSILAFQHGRLAFTRAKLLAADDRLSEGKRMSSEQISWVVRECLTSLHIWQEAAPDVTAPRVIVAVDEPEPALVGELEEALSSQVDLLDWTLFRQLGWTKRMQQLPFSAMPAVAGLC
jgi:hypothetical protein